MANVKEIKIYFNGDNAKIKTLNAVLSDAEYKDSISNI